MPSTLLPNAFLWAERYEAVREHRVRGRQLLGADPLGVVWLVQHGVAGWMHRWRESLGEARPVRATPALPLSPPTPVWQRQLTLLLAQMTLTQLRPTAAS